MKSKILFWLDMEWIRFGIAKFLQDLYECDLYALIDTDKVATDFYRNQNLVKFSKVWYYRDYVSEGQGKPDEEYLKKFEEKYKINLWQVAYSERFFYKYNIYYKFQYDEILSILEGECRLFETVLDEVKPDYLIIKLTDTHQSNLMHQLCKARGIRILMMNPTRFAYHFTISEEYDVMNNFDASRPCEGKSRSTSELQDYLRKNYTLDQTKEFESKLRISSWKRIKKYLNFLLKTSDTEFKKSYANYGKTTLKTLTKFLFLQKLYREWFVNKNSIAELEKSVPFVYYPLQTEPERTLLLGAPFYTDQIELITRIAKALPVGFKLYVKEHAAMAMLGWRKISFYKKILELPNVSLIHPSVRFEELITKCALVTTIRGTVGVEAAFYNKPAIVFSNVSYAALPSVHRLHDMEDLPVVIRNMLDANVDLNTVNNYVNYVEKNSFVINLLSLYTDLHEYFYEEFNGIGSKISNSKMNAFLERHRTQFEQLALEHLKIIKKGMVTNE